MGGFPGGLFGGAHHVLAAAGVDGEHLHAETCGSSDGLGDGVRDVVKFEVEENGGTGAANLADDLRPALVKSSLPIFTAPTAGAS